MHCICLLRKFRSQPLPGCAESQAGRGRKEKAVKAIKNSAVTRKQIAEILDVASSLDKGCQQVACEGGRDDETADDDGLQYSQVRDRPQQERHSNGEEQAAGASLNGFARTDCRGESVPTQQLADDLAEAVECAHDKPQED